MKAWPRPPAFNKLQREHERRISLKTDRQAQPDELVVDVAVADDDVAQLDQLGHQEVADELARLALTVPTPSNIALFGPWGSGKTGIGNMLRDHVKKSDGACFARVDAFKHAEVPLRREFLQAVAHQLGKDAAKPLEGLFESSQKSSVKLPPSELWNIFKVFILVIATVAAICCAAAALPGGSTGHQFGTYLLKFLPLALAPGIVASIIAATAGKSLTVQTTRQAPSANDEFEHIFKQMLEKTQAKRVVILVDELDRCAPAEVVSTLDAIRTFLGVPKCVFVVAADQQVLETALREASRQHAPSNEADPYYSSGAGYLDKLFGFQIHVPPPPSKRLTRYAVGLVQDKHGLWDGIDRERVVSALIPTHVRSPRRVKALLNAFALHYRLCARRLYADDTVELAPRAAEIARWCALRTEFPNFAAECAHDVRLLEATTALAVDQRWTAPERFPSAVTDRARAYLKGEVAVDELIVDDDLATKDVQVAQGTQLCDYLRRTRKVLGPSIDIIQLEAVGDAFGLPVPEANALEAAAVDGGTAEVLRALGTIAADLRTSAVDFLIQQLREATYGLEADNVLLCLLTAIDAYPEVVTRVRGARIAETVSSAELGELPSPARRAALRLAAHVPGRNGEDFLAAALPSDDAEHGDDVEVFGGLLFTCATPSVRNSERWRVAAVERVLTDEDAAGELLALTEDQRRTLVADLSPALAAGIFTIPDSAPAPETAVASGAAAAADPTVSDERLDAVMALAATLKVDDVAQAELLVALLAVDDPNVAKKTGTLLAERSEPMPARATTAILRRAGRSIWPSNWPIWFAKVTAGSVTPEDLAYVEQRLVDDAFNESVANFETTVRCGAQALRLIAGPDTQFVDLLKGFAARLKPAATVTAAEQQRALQVADRLEPILVEEECLRAESAAVAVLEAACHMLGPLARTDLDDWYSSAISSAHLRYADAELVGRVEAAIAQSGMPAQLARELRLRCAARFRDLGQDCETPLTFDELLLLRDTEPERAARMMALWLRAFVTDQDQAVNVVTRWFAEGQSTSPDIDAALATHVARDRATASALLDCVLRLGTQMPPRSTIVAIAEPLTPTERATALIDATNASPSLSLNESFVAWQRLDVTETRAAGRLVREVWIPALETADGSALASEHLLLLKSASSAAQTEAVDALLEAGKRHGTLSGIESKLEAAGYMNRKRKGWFKTQLERVRLADSDANEPDSNNADVDTVA